MGCRKAGKKSKAEELSYAGPGSVSPSSVAPGQHLPFPGRELPIRKVRAASWVSSAPEGCLVTPLRSREQKYPERSWVRAFLPSCVGSRRRGLDTSPQAGVVMPGPIKFRMGPFSRSLLGG